MNIKFLSTISLLFVARCMSVEPGKQKAPEDYEIPFDGNDEIIQQIIFAADGSGIGPEHREIMEKQSQILAGLSGSANSNRMDGPSGSVFTMVDPRASEHNMGGPRGYMPLNDGKGSSRPQPNIYEAEANRSTPIIAPPHTMPSYEHFYNEFAQILAPSKNHQDILGVQESGFQQQQQSTIQNDSTGAMQSRNIVNDRKRKASAIAIEGQQQLWENRHQGGENKQAVDSLPKRVHYSAVLTGSEGLEEVTPTLGKEPQQKFSLEQTASAQSQERHYQRRAQPLLAPGVNSAIGHYPRRGEGQQLPASTLGKSRTFPILTGVSPSTAQVPKQAVQAAQQTGGGVIEGMRQPTSLLGGSHPQASQQIGHQLPFGNIEMWVQNFPNIFGHNPSAAEEIMQKLGHLRQNVPTPTMNQLPNQNCANSVGHMPQNVTQQHKKVTNLLQKNVPTPSLGQLFTQGIGNGLENVAKNVPMSNVPMPSMNQLASHASGHSDVSTGNYNIHRPKHKQIAIDEGSLNYSVFNSANHNVHDMKVQQKTPHDSNNLEKLDRKVKWLKQNLVVKERKLNEQLEKDRQQMEPNKYKENKKKLETEIADLKEKVSNAEEELNKLMKRSALP